MLATWDWGLRVINSSTGFQTRPHSPRASSLSPEINSKTPSLLECLRLRGNLLPRHGWSHMVAVSHSAFLQLWHMPQLLSFFLPLTAKISALEKIASSSSLVFLKYSFMWLCGSTVACGILTHVRTGDLLLRGTGNSSCSCMSSVVVDGPSCSIATQDLVPCPGDQTHIPCLSRQSLDRWATREVLIFTFI